MDLMYYYTKADTMKYILTNGDIYATHISYLNDSEEYINGLRELKAVFGDSSLWDGEEICLGEQAYEMAIREIPQIYSISFSQEADLLSQWYMYAGESGVRLGMEFSETEQTFLVKQKGPDELASSVPIDAVLREVHYFTKVGMTHKEYADEKKAIRNMIKKYAEEKGMDGRLDENAIRLWKEIAPYIKNYEFRQEKEKRLVFNAVVGKTDASLIEYRYSNGMLIPYLDIYREAGWPVREIMVGPGRNQSRVFNSICHFVDNNALKIPEIDQRNSIRRFMNGMLDYQVDQEKVDEYYRKIEENMESGVGILTYNGQIYDILKDKDGPEREYLERNYYSDCGIIVRKSNAPYEFT